MSPAAMSCGLVFPGGRDGDDGGSRVFSDASFGLVFPGGGGGGTASGQDSRRRFVLCLLDGMELLCFPLGSFFFRVASSSAAADLVSGWVALVLHGGLMRTVRFLCCCCSLGKCQNCVLERTGGGEKGL